MNGDGILLAYDAARREAMIEKGNVSPAEIAAKHNLSTAFSAILVSVIEDWDKGDDNNDFFKVMSGIYRDTGNDPAARALAAEHASSCFKEDERSKWSATALLFSYQLAEQDAQHLAASTIFGLWDCADKTISPDEVHHGLNLMIILGAYNAPGRINWWVSMLELQFEDNPAAKAEAIEWLEELIERAEEEHAFNEYHLGKSRAKLAELIA